MQHWKAEQGPGNKATVKMLYMDVHPNSFDFDNYSYKDGVTVQITYVIALAC